jgi:hypothetical protein
MFVRIHFFCSISYRQAIVVFKVLKRFHHYICTWHHQTSSVCHRFTKIKCCNSILSFWWLSKCYVFWNQKIYFQTWYMLSLLCDIFFHLDLVDSEIFSSSRIYVLIFAVHLKNNLLTNEEDTLLSRNVYFIENSCFLDSWNYTNEFI